MSGLPADILQKFREWGRKGGRKAARRMTAAQRRARAIHAVQHRKHHPVKKPTELAEGIFWREAVPEDPMQRAYILMRRAPSMLPRFVSRATAKRYAESRDTPIEQAFARGVIEAVYGSAS